MTASTLSASSGTEATKEVEMAVTDQDRRAVPEQSRRAAEGGESVGRFDKLTDPTFEGAVPELASGEPVEPVEMAVPELAEGPPL